MARRFPAHLLCWLLLLLALLFLLHDAHLRGLAWNTCQLAVATAAISLPLGALLAFLVVRSDLPGRRGVLILLVGMLAVPLYVQTACWQAAWGTQGWLVRLVGADSVGGFAAAVGVHALGAVPWSALIVGVGLANVEPQLEEAALLEHPAWVVAWRVTLRRSLGALAAAALWVMVAAASQMVVTDQFQVRTYAEVVYQDLAIEPGVLPPGILPGVVLSAWLLLATGWTVSWLLPSGGETRLAPYDYRLGRYRLAAAGAVLLVLLVMVAVPVISLAIQAGWDVERTATGGFVRHWSVGKFVRLTATALWDYRRHVYGTLLAGIPASLISLLLGVLLAWWCCRSAWGSVVTVALLAAALSVPGPVLGLAAIWCFDRAELPWLAWLYDHTPAACWAVQAVRGLPPATLILWHALRSVPREQLDAAAIDGAGPAARLWHVALAQRRPACAAAFLAALLAAAAELDATLLVAPPGLETVSMHVFNLLHYDITDRVAALSLALYAAALAAGAAVMYLSHRSRAG